ncbi:MAG: IPT/TIG domain-containing protein [Planctomycetota bacterium]
MSGVDDLDGDGVDDIISSSHGTSSAGTSGRLRAFSGATGHEIPFDLPEFSGDQQFISRVVATGPDYNGDGFPEIVAGYFDQTNGVGLIRILSLGGTLEYSVAATHELELSGSRFSSSLLPGLTVTTRGTQPAASGFILASASSAATTFMGIPVAIGLGTDLLITHPITFDALGRNQFSINLSEPVLVGSSVFLQSFAVDGSAVLTSNGMEILFIQMGLSLDSVTPTIASAGDTITVIGDQIQPTAELLVNGQLVTPISITSTELVFTAPTNLTGCLDIITVRNALGFERSLPINPLPTISQVSQSSGPAAGGTALSIIGSGFQPGATVTFGSTPATFSVLFSAFISTISPPNPVGTTTITVTNPGGCSVSIPFTYF